MKDDLDTLILDDICKLLKSRLEKGSELKFIYRETGPMGDDVKENECGVEVGYKVVADTDE